MFCVFFVFFNSCNDKVVNATDSDELIKNLAIRKYELIIDEDQEEKYLLEFETYGREGSVAYVDDNLNPIIIALDNYNVSDTISIIRLKHLKLIQITMSDLRLLELVELPELKILKIKGINLNAEDSSMLFDLKLNKLPKLKTILLAGVRMNDFYVNNHTMLKKVDLYFASFNSLVFMKLPNLLKVCLDEVNFSKLVIDECAQLRTMLYEKK